MERPTGAGQRAGGWVLMIIGGIAFLLSLDNSGVGVDSMMRQWSLMIISGSAFGLAVLLFAVGWILRAIWFLPGREVEVIAADDPNPADGAGHESSGSRALTVWLVIGIFVMAMIIAWGQNGAP